MRHREETFKFRNYDPETGSARKHARLDEEDTVEKQVEGLTDAAIAQDEVQRAQELVRVQVLSALTARALAAVEETSADFPSSSLRPIPFLLVPPVSGLPSPRI